MNNYDLTVTKQKHSWTDEQGSMHTGYNFFLLIGNDLRVCIKPVFKSGYYQLSAFAVEEVASGDKVNK